MPLGPLMVDVNGLTLEPVERELLCHPLVGGVILFTRNYHDREQLQALVSSIQQLRQPQLLVAVDHEGGRVQRFRSGFTQLPPARVWGELYHHDPATALRLCEQCGWLMAAELRSVGVDFSFAPVLDLDYGVSSVIGDRAFAANPLQVTALARAFIDGMLRAGMAATGKHFPGHGAITTDSHDAIAVDDRRYEAIEAADLIPFQRLADRLAAVMPAHVIYPKVDRHAAGFSPFWLQQVLRQRLAYQGLIFSDDLNMAGAGGVGDHLARATAALDAGCDVALLCNNRPAVEQLLSQLERPADPVLGTRLARLHGRHAITTAELVHSVAWREANSAVRRLQQDPSFELTLS